MILQDVLAVSQKMFDVQRIRESTNIDSVEVHSQLGSTNNRAIELIRNDEVNLPGLIVAVEQFAGRGQRERHWWSDSASLTFSWIAPELVPSTHPLLPLAAALAVTNALESATTLDHLEIKWPNDVLVERRKLCGILVESIATANGQGVVIGVGINVNNHEINTLQINSQADSATRPSFQPTSILIETQQQTPIEGILIAVVNQLRHEWEQIIVDPESIVDRCNQRLAFRNETILFHRPSGEPLPSRCVQIEVDGGLTLESNSERFSVFSGTIESP